MKGLMRKLSRDMRASNEIIECMENNKENMKRSLSLEAMNKILTESSESLKKDPERRRKLSGLSMRITRKMSDSGNVIKRKISLQPELRVRKASIPAEMRARKVSMQPELSIGNVVVPSEKRVRKGSVQPNMLAGRRAAPVKADLKSRKMSVPANMKFHSAVRVRKVSFINQSTGKAFEMNKT